jgi:hypothetical protein
MENFAYSEVYFVFLLQWAFVEILIWVINLRCASHNNICHVATHNLPIVARALSFVSRLFISLSIAHS